MTVIKDISTADRPREKMLRFGEAYLTNSELLALLLNTSGSRERSVLDLSREILGTEAGLRELSGKSITELTRTKGIGPAKAVVIKAAFELAHRYEEESHPLPRALHSPAEIAKHFLPRFRDSDREVFMLLGLSARQQLVCEKQLAIGSLTEVATNPREIFGALLNCRAAGFILMHNHPSGEPTPSGHDAEITQRVKKGGELLGMPLLDHIILGESSYFSFQEAGLL